MYKQLSIILFVLSLILGIISIVFAIYAKEGINKWDINAKDLHGVLATIAGTLATCAMFAFQKYEFDCRLNDKDKAEEINSIYRLIHQLIKERGRIKIEYPSIDEHWQEIQPHKEATGIDAFLQMHKMAEILMENLNYEVYLTHNNEIAAQLLDNHLWELEKWKNQPEENDEVMQKFECCKKQMLNGLYNNFADLNKSVYELNHKKTEMDKRSLCAYYVLTLYESKISQYLFLACSISNKIDNFKKNNDIQELMIYIRSNLSEFEWKLICEYLIYKKPILKSMTNA